jgi:hypothetical protein
MKLELSREIFENYSCIKFHENPSSGTDRQDKAKSRFSEFCERA